MYQFLSSAEHKIYFEEQLLVPIDPPPPPPPPYYASQWGPGILISKETLESVLNSRVMLTVLQTSAAAYRTSRQRGSWTCHERGVHSQPWQSQLQQPRQWQTCGSWRPGEYITCLWHILFVASFFKSKAILPLSYHSSTSAVADRWWWSGMDAIRAPGKTGRGQLAHKAEDLLITTVWETVDLAWWHLTPGLFWSCIYSMY